MESRVILKVRKGQFDWTTQEYTEHTRVFAGRSKECNLKISELPDKTSSVSRMQCLLEIIPPTIHVRDAGSRNGTFVNGKLIGKREADETPEEGQKRAYSVSVLNSGDILTLGSEEVEFEIEIVVAVVCHDCGVEIAQAEQAQCLVEGQYVCPSCQKKTRIRPSQDAGGEDLLEILRQLLAMAKPDEPDLAALKLYEIQGELGRGGLGIVYKAQHRSNRRIVALKVMRPAVAANKAGRLLFDRERANMEALNHPNIVRFYETGKFGGNYYLAMEYCDGGTLLDLLYSHQRALSVEKALYLTCQALDGLAYAHQADIPHAVCADGTHRSGKGLVHRDIKPENLFLSGSGRNLTLKVADFGLAKAFDIAGMSGMTAMGQAMGTPHFMPRQQVLNFRYVKPEVDVWAMAGTLYFMLTGEYPKGITQGDDPWAVAAERDAIPIRRHRPDLPAKLAGVIDKALKDSDSLAFGSAQEFKHALEAAQ